MSEQPTSNQRCTCVRCGECRGTGTVWYSFGSTRYGGGQYLGSGRSDDLDEMETCEECRGSGISEECDNCSFRRELDEDDL